MDNRETDLKKSEWIFGFAMLMFIFSILWIANISSGHSLEQMTRIEAPPAVSFIDIEVTGCIKKPKTLRIPCGSQVRDCLKKIRLKDEADVASFDLNQVLIASGVLEIPSIEKIVVEVEGCVTQNIRIDMPLGSRICDLKQRLILTDDADLAFFKRQRRLKNNEIICVPVNEMLKKTSG